MPFFTKKSERRCGKSDLIRRMWQKLLDLMREQQFGKLVASCTLHDESLCAGEGGDIRKFSTESWSADDLRRDGSTTPGKLLHNFHPGSPIVGQGGGCRRSNGLRRQLNEVLTPGADDAEFSLETMAGKGSEVGRRL